MTPRQIDEVAPVIVLSRDARDAILTHAREEAPYEACGVLAGTYGRTLSRVETTYPTPNVASSPRVTYEIDPEQLFETVETIESAGTEVVGFYHSHPTGPQRPSPTDEAQATWEEYSYLIVDRRDDPDLGSWRWTGTDFEEERLEIQ
jgi:proteasome lid subunit RPN8/RPN11